MVVTVGFLIRNKERKTACFSLWLPTLLNRSMGVRLKKLFFHLRNYFSTANN